MSDEIDPTITTTASGIRVIDKRRRLDLVEPDPVAIVPKFVKDFFHPPARVKALIIPCSAEASFKESSGFSMACTKGWARAAAGRWKTFSGAGGMFLSQYGAFTHVLTFDRTADKVLKDGYAPEKRPPPEISMQGASSQLLSYHVIVLPVRKLEADPYDMGIIARSMRRLAELVDTIPSLVIHQEPGCFWMPIIRDKVTPWDKTRPYVEPYLASTKGRVILVTEERDTPPSP